mmetsp:Transcript_147422/g.456057  ORF Transcript_147422/g.456057 Transcript_147422/m.456057 type:complete len:205 (-) Transcript_147422:177-791(-)
MCGGWGDALGEDPGRSRGLLALLRALHERRQFGSHGRPHDVRRGLALCRRGPAVLLPAPAHRDRRPPRGGQVPGVRRRPSRVRAERPEDPLRAGPEDGRHAGTAGRAQHERHRVRGPLATGLPRARGCWRVEGRGADPVPGPLRDARPLAPERPSWPSGILPLWDRARARLRLRLLALRRHVHTGEVSALLQGARPAPLRAEPG